MYFDILALIFSIILTLIMMKRGGVRALVSLCSLVISIVIAMSLYPVLTDAVYQTPVPENIEKTVSAAIAEKYGETFDLEALDAMPEFIQKAVSGSVAGKAQDMTDTLSRAVTKAIIEVLLFLTVIVLTKLLLAFLVKFLDLIVKLPIIKQFNSLTGILCGVGMSFIIVWVASMVLGVMSASNQAAAEFMKDSSVAAFMNGISLF